MLEVSAMKASYGAVEAVRGATLSLATGEVLAVIGPNGAGKSTLAHAITGVHKRRTGRVVLDGRDLTGASAVTISRAGMTLVPQGRRLFGSCTVAEHVMLTSIHRRPGALPLDDILELFPRLRERWNVRAKALSGGEQQILSIARAALLGPSVIVLDEPTEGLAPSIVDLVGQLIGRLRDQGVATLLMEQHGGFPFTVADRVLTIDRGVLQTADGTGPADGPHATRGAVPASGSLSKEGSA